MRRAKDGCLTSCLTACDDGVIGCWERAFAPAPVDYDAIAPRLKTGDLFLFSSKHAASHVTKCFTGSGWDHLGMVVKLSDSQVFILEYAGGVFLYPLFTRLYSYFAIQGREICLRRLSLPHERPEMQAQVEEFVRGVLGQKPPSIEEMVLAVLSQQSILSAFIVGLLFRDVDARAAIGAVLFGISLYAYFTFVHAPFGLHYIHLMFVTLWTSIAFSLAVNRLVFGKRASLVRFWQRTAPPAPDVTYI